MAASFTITTDPRRDLVRIVLAGFFDVEEAVRLGSEVQAAVKSLRAGPNQHYTLINVSACDLQSQIVVSTFQEILAEPRFMARRLAFVTTNSLARMQVRRLIINREAACFEDDAAALAWLFENDEFEAKRA